MSLSLGTRLRAQRERQQIPLATIAEQTKIRYALLDGLERDDVSYWPDGIFRRAYVRAYAQAIGLDPGPVVTEFLDLYPDTVEVIPAEYATSQDSTTESARRQPPTRLRFLIQSAVAAIPGLIDRVRGGETVPRSTGSAQPARESVKAPQPDLRELADLCTRFGQAVYPNDIAQLLGEAARVLDAAGLVVWSWEPRANVLKVWLAHGYSDAVLAQLPSVRRDAENAVAVAFRSAKACVVDGRHEATGAIVIPLMSPRGCAGVLALELAHGGERREHVRTLATILAAQLANMVEATPLAEAVNA